MLSHIINSSKPNNSQISIGGQIELSKNILGSDHPAIVEAKIVVQKYDPQKEKLRKSELLEIWQDNEISFTVKCLITLWWGHPKHFYVKNVYSLENISKLNSGKLKDALYLLSQEEDFNKFKEGLDNLYSRLSNNGDLHLNSIGVTFFTKFFHFFFATHPIQSNPAYLPVIADNIIRSAVFAEMMDNNENIDDIFNTRDASLRSYTAFTDKFNEYVNTYSNLTAFELEDVLFSNTSTIGKVYVDAYNRKLCLPDWIAGRYNEKENIAIVFNNLIGETYLFEQESAILWRELLKYDYGVGFDIESLCRELNCCKFELISFFIQLLDKNIIVNHKLTKKELDTIKKRVNKSKHNHLKSNNNIDIFRSSYDSVDNDYRNRILSQGIPFAASIELTYACNEACIHCYNPNSPRLGEMGAQKIKPKGELDTQEYFSVLDEMAKMGTAKIVFTGGDPFMKKDLISILKYAHKLKFAISVYTNGQFLYNNMDLYSQLRDLYPQHIGLSLYSTIPEVHDSITRRKGSCEKTMAVAKLCYKDAIGLQIKCPIMQNNKDSYGLVYDFAFSVNGVPQFDVNITSSIDGDCYASQKLRLTEEQLRVILKDSRIPLSIENNTGVMERMPQMDFCGAGFASINIQPDGTITPCAAYPLNCGNIREQKLTYIWEHSPQLHHVRSLRYGQSDICGKENFCKYCNRCIGQSYVEHGVPQNHSEDNCFIAKIRHELAQKE